MVFVAASAADAVEDAGKRFELETGVAVSVNAAASSVLAQQIAAGAEADLFLSANVVWCDYLDERGHVIERVDLLKNRLVLIVPSSEGGAIGSPEDLLRDEIRRIAVADTEAVPAGVYAKQALVGMGLWDSLEQKVLPGGNVRQAMVYVERGEADAGIVYATDALLTDEVRIVHTFDLEGRDPIVYPLILTSTGGERVEAMQLFEYLQSSDARSLFDGRGFVGIQD